MHQTTTHRERVHLFIRLPTFTAMIMTWLCGLESGHCGSTACLFPHLAGCWKLTSGSKLSSPCPLSRSLSFLGQPPSSQPRAAAIVDHCRNHAISTKALVVKSRYKCHVDRKTAEYPSGICAIRITHSTPVLADMILLPFGADSVQHLEVKYVNDAIVLVCLLLSDPVLHCL